MSGQKEMLKKPALSLSLTVTVIPTPTVTVTAPRLETGPSAVLWQSRSPAVLPAMLLAPCARLSPQSNLLLLSVLPLQ